MNSRSISARLTIMNLLVSGAALLLASAGFFAYDQVTFRQALERTLSAQAQIIGSNSVSALLFNDPQAAASTLSALRTSTNIASAGILTADKRVFANYTRVPGDETVTIPAMPEGQDEAFWFRRAHLVLMRPISSEGRVIGYVYIRAELREIDVRLQRYGLIAVAVLLLSLLFALFVSRTFQKSLAGPIIRLAEMTRRVSREKDYSLRMPASTDNNEVAVLIDSFNAMLEEVQERDRSLQKAHDELEQRVEERTRDLVSANRELEAFSYSVSHDLRGPIDALNGFSYVLLQQYGAALGSAGKEIVDHIRASARRMRDLIDVLLNLSRVTTSSIHIENVDLSAMVRSIADDLSRAEPRRQVEFKIAQVEPVQGDARLLRIALDNLLRNSWKYTSKHATARIEFGANHDMGRTIFYVKDDGAGFDAAAAGQLFQPFQRLHKSTEFQGDGIGLATVRRILGRHGGEIWARGAREEGATFFFVLPQQGREPGAR